MALFGLNIHKTLMCWIVAVLVGCDLANGFHQQRPCMFEYKVNQEKAVNIQATLKLHNATDPPVTIAAPPLSTSKNVVINIATCSVSFTGVVAALTALPDNYVGVMDNKNREQPRMGVFNVFEGTVRPLEIDAQLASCQDLEAIVPVPNTNHHYFVMASKGVVYECVVNVLTNTVHTVTTFEVPKLAEYQNIEAMAVMALDDGSLRMDYMQRGGQSKGFSAVIPETGAAILTRGNDSTWRVERIHGSGMVTPPTNAPFMRAVTDHSGKWMMSATDVEELDDGLATGAGLSDTHDTTLVWTVDGTSTPVFLIGGKAEGIWANGDAMDIVTDDETRGTTLVRIVHGHVMGVRQLTHAREFGLSGIAPLSSGAGLKTTK